MCGIAGFIKFSNNLSSNNLARHSVLMADTLEKRGPDKSGFWIDTSSGIALSHRRLSIIDLSNNASQPMISSDKRYVLVYNGEIYNFKNLKNSLKKKIKFQTRSDTEVLLELISTLGVERATRKLNGIFAFAVWDREEKKLSICRDRVGVKPVYIYWDKKNFAFASEIKSLKTLPWLNFTICRKSLSSYVRLNYIPSPYSIFKNIFKLEPGSIFEIPLDRQTSIKKYWD